MWFAFCYERMRRRGFFITFEGIDGCGKTTQLTKAGEYLRRRRKPLTLIREPGSTPLSEKIRKILLDRGLKIGNVSELMLYLAARAELVDRTIAPALAGGRIILCDRFHDSTTAYQGYGRGIDINLIRRLNSLTVGEFVPDLTFLIDLDYKTSLLRRKPKADRLESESKAFFKRVRNGFLEIAKSESGRMIVINGKKPVNEIAEEVKCWIDMKLKIK
jgi:dTMP kinase